MKKSDARKAAEELACEAFPLPWDDAQKMRVNRQNFVDAFLLGYNAGLEDAGKLCDERARQLREDMPGKPAAITNSLSLARLIRSLKEAP